MPYRTVRPRSDRGSIKDLAYISDEYNDAPTPEELELKQKYEHAQATRDQQLQDSLGFIVMPNAGDRSAFPISVYRHREYINSLSQKRAVQIEKTKQELAGCFPSELKKLTSNERVSQYKQIFSRQAVLSQGELLIKVASADVSVQSKRSFRRSR